jgi:hypothetical protein
VRGKDSDLSSHLAAVAKGFQLCHVDHCVPDNRKGRRSEEERAENERREGHLDENVCIGYFVRLQQDCEM